MNTQTNTDKVLYTFDFDGVVSPIDREKNFKSDPAYQAYKFGYLVYIRPEVAEFATWASTQPNSETVWCTSWVDMTQGFHEKSNGRIPALPYLELNGTDKAHAIIAKAIEVQATIVHVFEDSVKVRTALTNLTKKNNYPFEVVFHKSNTKTGITDRMIKQVKGL